MDMGSALVMAAVSARSMPLGTGLGTTAHSVARGGLGLPAISHAPRLGTPHTSSRVPGGVGACSLMDRPRACASRTLSLASGRPPPAARTAALDTGAHSVTSSAPEVPACPAPATATAAMGCRARVCAGVKGTSRGKHAMSVRAAGTGPAALLPALWLRRALRPTHPSPCAADMGAARMGALAQGRAHATRPWHLRPLVCGEGPRAVNVRRATMALSATPPALGEAGPRLAARTVHVLTAVGAMGPVSAVMAMPARRVRSSAPPFLGGCATLLGRACQ